MMMELYLFLSKKRVENTEFNEFNSSNAEELMNTFDTKFQKIHKRVYKQESIVMRYILNKSIRFCL